MEVGGLRLLKLANYLTIKRKKARPLSPRAESPGEVLAIVELNRLISNTPLTAQDRVALRTFFTEEPIYATAFFSGNLTAVDDQPSAASDGQTPPGRRRGTASREAAGEARAAPGDQP